MQSGVSLFLVFFFWRNQFLERFFVIGNKIFVGMSSREAVCVKNSAYFSLYFFHKTDCVIRTFTKCTKLKLSNSILTAVLKIVYILDYVPKILKCLKIVKYHFQWAFLNIIFLSIMIAHFLKQYVLNWWYISEKKYENSE